MLAKIRKAEIAQYWERQPQAKGVSVRPLDDVDDVLPAGVDPAVTVEQRDTIRRAAAVLNPVEPQVVAAHATGHMTTEIAELLNVMTSRVREIERQAAERATALLAEPVATFEWLASIARLTRRQRDVMALTYDGHKPPRIASALGITANRARVNLRHAKLALSAMPPDPPEQAGMYVEQMVDLSRVRKYFGRFELERRPDVGPPSDRALEFI